MAGLASRLGERHHVTLLTLDRADRDRYEVANLERVGLDVMGVSTNAAMGLRANMHRVAAVREAISSRKPNVVLSFCDKMNIVVLAATRPLRIPTVITEFTDPRHQPMSKPWHALRRLYYLTAAHGVALNQSTLPIVKKWVGGPVTVISAAVDEPPAGFAHRVSTDGRLRLTGVGRLSPEKGFDRLVKAFIDIADQVPQWDLEIAGDGPDRDAIATLVRDAKLQSRIRLIGWIKDVWGFLATADAFALTSRYDGYPVALLEAMAAGIAVVSVDCDSGPREIIRNGVNGLLVDNSEIALREGLLKLLQDTPLRERLAQGGPEVLQRLSWRKFTDDYESVLFAALERSERKRR